MTHFQNKMSGQSLAGATIKTKIVRATAMANALHMEVSELQDSWSWKTTRDPLRVEDPKVDKDNVCREIIDCLFFLHHIGECFDIEPTDLEAKYIEVMANNRRRHIDGDLSGQKESEAAPINEELATINAKLDQLLNGDFDHDIKKCKV